MGIADRAARESADRRAREESEAAGGSGDPQRKEYVPRGKSWDEFEGSVGDALELLLGEHPGPAQRLEPGSAPMRIHAHQYPADLQRRRVLVFRPEGLEIAAVGTPRGSGERAEFYAITRSSNPMEEAMATRVRTIADLGDAIS